MDSDEPCVRTAKVLQRIGNSINRCIQLTYDTPALNVTRKLPVLDLEVYTANNVVLHNFYKKPIASIYTIQKRSAMSDSVKLQTCFMECMRRMLNCSVQTPWNTIADHLSKFSYSMMISGYSQKERYNTVKGAIVRYRTMLDEIKIGMRQTLHRSGKEIRDRKSVSQNWANTWFLRENTIATVSCSATPGSRLKRTLNKAINPEGVQYRTQVIEDGGMPVHCGLMVSDPMRPNGCIFQDPNCIVAGKCDVSGVTYRIECNTCNQTIYIETEVPRYIGMTRTTLHNRMLGHLKDQKYKCNKSPLHRHDRDSHNGEIQSYTMRKIGSEKKIVRLACLEALEIEKQPENLIMNEKNEQGRGGLVRISALRISS